MDCPKKWNKGEDLVTELVSRGPGSASCQPFCGDVHSRPWAMMCQGHSHGLAGCTEKGLQRERGRVYKRFTDSCFLFLMDGSSIAITLALQEIGNKINIRWHTIFFSFKFSFQGEGYYLFPSTRDKNFWNSTEGQGEEKKRMKERRGATSRCP